MNRETSLHTEASRLAAMPLAEAREAFGQRVRATFALSGADFANSLDFNAHLTTRLRERGVRLWGEE